MSSHSPEIRIQVPDIEIPDNDDNQGPLSLPSPSSLALKSSPLPTLNTNLLSPTAAAHHDVPYSPTTSFGDTASVNDNYSILTIPPSPTLSNRSSVHFEPNSTVALRDNNPTAKSGGESLALLSPGDAGYVPGNSHRRKGSTATQNSYASSNTEAGTDPDSHSPRGHNELSYIKTNTTEATRVPSRNQSRDSSDATRKGKGRASTDDDHRVADTSKDDDSKKTQVELDEEDSLKDPAPFAFTPLTLARMLDPKDYNSLAVLGGIDGLLKGLGVDPTQGLLRQERGMYEQSPSEEVKQGVGGTQSGAGFGASHRHAPMPAIVLTHPDAKDGEGDIVKPGSTPSIQLNSLQNKDPAVFDPRSFDASGAFGSGFDKRREIYGANTLPVRKSKSLIALMAAAMKDKVLILLSIAAVVSLALGLFQDFGEADPIFSLGFLNSLFVPY